MYAIPIIPITLDLVVKLNDGVTPELELDKYNNPSYFIYRSFGAHEIVSHDDYMSRFDGGNSLYWHNIRLSYYMQ